MRDWYTSGAEVPLGQGVAHAVDSIQSPFLYASVINSRELSCEHESILVLKRTVQFEHVLSWLRLKRRRWPSSFWTGIHRTAQYKN